MQHSSTTTPTAATLGRTARRIVGTNVRTLRKAHGWSQVELGKRIGMGQGTVSAIESGKRCPSLPTLFLLAQACEVQTEQLVRRPGGAEEASTEARR